MPRRKTKTKVGLADKLVFGGHMVPVVSGTCSVCEHFRSECFDISVDDSHGELYKRIPFASDLVRIVKDWEFNFFGQKILKDYEHKHIDKYEKVATYHVLVCKDCIAQMAEAK